MSFKIGECYRIISNDNEFGNIIKITNIDSEHEIVFYKTIKSNNPILPAGVFNYNSELATQLVHLDVPENIHAQEEKIVVSRDANEITAIHYVNNQEINTATVNWNPSDNTDFKYTAKLAIEKLVDTNDDGLVHEFDWSAFKQSKFSVHLEPYNLRIFIELAKLHNCIWRYSKVYNSIELIAHVVSTNNKSCYLYIDSSDGLLKFDYTNPEIIEKSLKWTPSVLEIGALKINWYKFKTGSLAVQVSKSNISGFLKVAESLKITWEYGAHATDFNPFEIKYFTSIKCDMLWIACQFDTLNQSFYMMPYIKVEDIHSHNIINWHDCIEI